MKVAFTTSDGTHIDTHFGVAKEIDVYEVSKDGFNFVETLTFEGDLEAAEHEDKITPKMEAIIDCKIVYVKAIGTPVGNKLTKQGVTLVRAQEYDRVPDILHMLVKSCNGDAPPLLRKALLQEENDFAYSHDEE
ncbi:dinitrogenase iron-molybdenum cofactor biosynthesis domain-containing protein [Tolypothrix tenuis PCC 7101]|uniref:Dinitrogenase iron-molybdenum cofactor biosynthesis domain-containing protein n=1 Tax=Tolypothrix tenuis PCC 7101 TaxID=231146 RepID=A0A1Z4N2K1_9CYAN|nr:MULTISPECIES: nitrogen fixation protein NifX [unclassified Tolypothrix]MBD2237116.1 nitrogen fixation protein NifX [Aulosira sp. FACHB-113]BAY28978.1 dinitrogenase iron-molybdenum cofactor biosynthesis domain-containing protein [Nostoc carneum NIES-2107]BAY91251.1 dinitrogenase iron-molybdenum cofactor biosynthesis domain-containing protein [Microchaete diplosiphon NIES-3275]BAY99957.1 dinitrogenase iron-molybdenum cofactor biosynthesis domain-containing protein [Tolypothrix tenuis PCC 7101]